MKLITYDQASFLPGCLKINLNFRSQVLNVNKSRLEQSLPYFQKPICHSLYSVITLTKGNFSLHKCKISYKKTT